MDQAELMQVNDLIDEGVAGFRELMSQGCSVDECTEVLAEELSDGLAHVAPKRMAVFVAVAVRRLAV